MIQIVGHISIVTFEKMDFRVVKFHQETGGEIIASGNPLSAFQPKEPVILHGDWEEYYNKKKQTTVNQFTVKAAFHKQPTDLPSLEIFLARAVPGCGPVKARAMVRKHGEKLFDFLRQGRADKLLEVKGIGGPTAERIVNGFQARSIGYHIAEFLCSIGVTPDWTERIQRALGPDAIRLIRKNPYSLIRVRGIAYKTADDIALKLGWKRDSIERAEATLFCMLEDASDKGHTFLRRQALIEAAVKEMYKAPVISADDPTAAEPAADASPAPTEAELTALLNQALDACYERNGGLVKEVANTTAGPVEMVYIKRLYSAEVRLARKIRILRDSKPVCRYTTEQMTWIVKESEKALDIDLTEEQRSAIINAFQQPISILTGGPGTGKTATMRVLVNVAKRIGYSLSLCAPTGRAAKHLSNVTDEPALTIHRLLNYNATDDEWRHNENDQLDTGMVISDEFSMVDIDLASRIADAIKPGTPWLMIGDKDQLPSVSPGRVLEDLIKCGKIPVTRLTKIFRQAEKSLIVQNAYRILKGELLRFPPPKRDAAVEMADCYCLEPPSIPALDEKGKQKKNNKGNDQKIEDYEWIKSRILSMCKDRIPNRMQLDPIRDVQVLTPMREKGLGAKVLNETLQDALNPQREGVQEVAIGTKRFRTGDRVQQHRNNYRLGDDYEGVYNGDIGFIRRIDEEEQLLEVDFGGAKPIMYPFEDAKQDLHLGYAMTVHRSQGGEFPVVIVVLLSANSIMLQRNLLYTAVTRAQRLLVFVGQSWVLKKAVLNSEIQARNSFLATRMRRETESVKAEATN